MNHVNAVLERDSDDIILSEISSYGRQSLSDLISLIGLLSMSGHLVFNGVDCYGLHSKLVGGSEDTNGDFTSVGDEDLLEGSSMASLFLSQSLDTVVVQEVPSVLPCRDSENWTLLTYVCAAGVLVPVAAEPGVPAPVPAEAEVMAERTLWGC